MNKVEGEKEEAEEDVWKQTWTFFLKKFLIQISNLNFTNATEAREGMVTFSILAYLWVYNMFGVYIQSLEYTLYWNKKLWVYWYKKQKYSFANFLVIEILSSYKLSQNIKMQQPFFEFNTQTVSRKDNKRVKLSSIFSASQPRPN